MIPPSYSTLAAILIAGALLSSPFSTFGQPLETLNASYASVTGSRIPLWIAKDAGLFEKQGLHVNLVVIAAGNAAIGALAGGDVEILGAPGSTTMVSAARGLPVAIIGTFGPGAWKLVAIHRSQPFKSCVARRLVSAVRVPPSNLLPGARC